MYQLHRGDQSGDYMANHKLAPLEGQRGIAAVVVFLHHFLLGFHPTLTGVLPSLSSPNSLAGSPLFVLVNGAGAVFFFFTLSGFVLSWGYFHDPEGKSMFWAAVKRWPRLAGPVVLTTMASVVMFHLGLFAFQAAGAKSGSPWLSAFAYSTLADYSPSLGFGLWQGMTTFITGEANLNTSLWTMVYEYYGSLAVFALAPLLLRLPRRIAYGVLAVCLALTVFRPSNLPLAVAALGLAFLLPFLSGMGLAFLLSRPARRPEMGWVPTVALVVAGLYLLGYHHPSPAYGWAAPLVAVSAEEVARPLVYTLGASLLILATMMGRELYAALDRPFMKNLGRISFPLYLVHVLIIASASSWLYVNVLPDGGPVLFAVTLALCLMVSRFLLLFDEWWVGRVNATTAAARRVLAVRRHGILQ